MEIMHSLKDVVTCMEFEKVKDIPGEMSVFTISWMHVLRVSVACRVRGRKIHVQECSQQFQRKALNKFTLTRGKL